MIANRTADQATKINVPLVDANGTCVDATAVTWKLFDERGEELAAGTPADFTAGDTAATVELTADTSRDTAPQGALA